MKDNTATKYQKLDFHFTLEVLPEKNYTIFKKSYTSSKYLRSFAVSSNSRKSLNEGILTPIKGPTFFQNSLL